MDSPRLELKRKEEGVLEELPLQLLLLKMKINKINKFLGFYL